MSPSIISPYTINNSINQTPTIQLTTTISPPIFTMVSIKIYGERRKMPSIAKQVFFIGANSIATCSGIPTPAQSTAAFGSISCAAPIASTTTAIQPHFRSTY